jgi:hypothetical protein
MIIRATNGDKLNVSPDDQFSLKIVAVSAGGYLLFLNTPHMDSLDIHYGLQEGDLIRLSDAIMKALLAGRESFDAEQELRKYRQGDPVPETKVNAYEIYRLAVEIRDFEDNIGESAELARLIIAQTGICPSCDGMGCVPEEDGEVRCLSCSGSGVLLPPAPDQTEDMPF